MSESRTTKYYGSYLGEIRKLGKIMKTEEEYEKGSAR